MEMDMGHGESWKSHGIKNKVMEKMYQFQIIVDTVSLNCIIYKINCNNNNTQYYV